MSEYEEPGLEAGYEEAPELMLFLVPVADTEPGLTREGLRAGDALGTQEMGWTLGGAEAGGRDRRGANTGDVAGSGGRHGGGPGRRRSKGGDASRAQETGRSPARAASMYQQLSRYAPNFLFASRSLTPPPQQAIEALFSTGIRVRTTSALQIVVVHEARNSSCRIGGACE